MRGKRKSARREALERFYAMSRQEWLARLIAAGYLPEGTAETPSPNVFPPPTEPPPEPELLH